MPPRGEWTRYDAKHTVDFKLSLDIRELAREGELCSERANRVTWTPRWFATGVSVRVDECDDDIAHIAYTRDDVERAERVEVEWTRPNYGGRRPWWKCPECERRCAILYYHGAPFRCRLCAGLTHTSSQLGRPWRVLHQSIKLKRRLDWWDGDLAPVKPPRMHWRTWERRLAAYAPAARAASTAMEPTLDRRRAEQEQARQQLMEFLQ